MENMNSTKNTGFAFAGLLLLAVTAVTLFGSSDGGGNKKLGMGNEEIACGSPDCRSTESQAPASREIRRAGYIAGSRELPAPRRIQTEPNPHCPVPPVSGERSRRLLPPRLIRRRSSHNLRWSALHPPDARRRDRRRPHSGRKSGAVGRPGSNAGTLPGRISVTAPRAE